MEMNTTALPYRTYAENVRMAAKQRGLNIRDLSNQTQYSFEHIRKIWMGQTTKRAEKLSVSRECNDLLCDVLGLPADAMFTLAEQEKLLAKHGHTIPLNDPVGSELVHIWERLTGEQRQILLRIAQGLQVELAHAS